MNVTYTNGTAKFINPNEYLEWYKALPLEDAKAIFAKVKGTQHQTYVTPVWDAARDMLCVTCWSSHPVEETEAYKWPIQRDKYTEHLSEFIQMSEDYSIPLRVGEWYEDNFAFLYLGNPDKGIIVPDAEKYLEYIPVKDYSDVSPAQLRAELAFSSTDARMAMIPTDADMLTPNMVADQKAVYESALEKANAEMETIKNNTAKGLSELQTQIQKLQEELTKKRDAMMQQLQEKMAEMEAMKESLEMQIYLLDSQIYAIRCFAGEIVKFAKIRSGKNAPNSSPIVIYQKLHFLDEDLGRMASIYEIQWHELNKFEDFLRYSTDALDNFVPNERCISLVRLSKENRTIQKNDRMPFQNMLRSYEYYHGATVGILIRNGENLYLGWTEEERIHITDDLIISQVITETEPAKPQTFYSKYEQEKWEENQKKQRKQLIDGIISRSFDYNILQGVVEHTPLLPLPAGVTLGRQSEYVIYSVADMWITDNRFGSFTDIIERCNENITKGDPVLTVQHLIPEREAGYYGSLGWSRHHENVRGRGWANRTHDCSVDDCTIYPVNFIEKEAPVRMLRYRWRISPDAPWLESSIEESKKDRLTDDTEIEFLGEYDYIRKTVFVSVEKKYSDAGARSNFEIHSSEYINLQYMNSVWLEYVICNKTLGNWRIGGEYVNYAYAIKYLKTALDFIRKREETEKANLDAVNPAITTCPEWQVALSEWKMSRGIRELTPYQAKRFAKHLSTDSSATIS